MELQSLKNLTYTIYIYTEVQQVILWHNDCLKRLIYSSVDLALNNLQWLICYKTKPNPNKLTEY